MFEGTGKYYMIRLVSLYFFLKRDTLFLLLFEFYSDVYFYVTAKNSL